MTENKKLLGKRIKQIRKNAGFTQEKLSELIGIETGSLSTIESGRSFPSLVTLEKISQILNVEMKAFFDYDTSITIKDMKKIIVKNIDKIKENQIPYIYKYFEGLNQQKKPQTIGTFLLYFILMHLADFYLSSKPLRL